jgi:nicotinamidase/pyrazinamidase
MSFIIYPNDALIVIDIQNDFVHDGALAVNKGDEIINGINKLIGLFYVKESKIILTQDWHPPKHFSFASQHKGKQPFDPIEGVPGIGPVLWPDHCVQGTKGAEFPRNLDVDKAHLILRKGIHHKIDSYSAFTENDRQTDTGLAGYLENVRVKRIFICGLALDYCVYWSASDGIEKGFETFVLPDLCKGIDQGTTENAISEMRKEGINLLELKDFG